ncbi:MAG TPA: hypothetical protein VG943_15275 [Caulobacterales bacterium]|nr:hypothetical protein [Caulobacterales bacterium]
MPEPTPPYAKYFERLLLVCAAIGVALGIEGLGYSNDASVGDYMLAPAIGLVSLGFALAVGFSVPRSGYVLAAFISIALMYVFDALNLGYLGYIRDLHAEQGFAGLRHVYWTFVAPASAIFASVATGIVIALRANSL